MVVLTVFSKCVDLKLGGAQWTVLWVIAGMGWIRCYLTIFLLFSFCTDCCTVYAFTLTLYLFCSSVWVWVGRVDWRNLLLSHTSAITNPGLPLIIIPPLSDKHCIARNYIARNYNSRQCNAPPPVINAHNLTTTALQIISLLWDCIVPAGERGRGDAFFDQGTNAIAMHCIVIVLYCILL